MNTLDKIREIAQRDADRTGKSLVIINLNQYNPMYVIRTWVPMFRIPTYATKHGFVERIDPKSNERGLP